MYTESAQNTRPLCALDAKYVARALGGVVVGRNQVSAPGPGHSHKDLSLSIRLSHAAPDGFTLTSHAGDDWRECRDYVKERLGLKTGSRPQPVSMSNVIMFDAPDPDKIASAIAVWNEGVDPCGTPVEAYLASRALKLDDTEALRWHPRLRAMLALFRNIITDEPQAISRTFLDHEGRKRERKFLGPTKGAAIKLDADDKVLGGLHIGEGIETCMAARMMGLRPTWALGSAGAIATFPVLNGVECLTILREHDEANKRAADACGDVWLMSGREVTDALPITGKDLNDSIKGAA